MTRYARQTQLPNIGPEGQAKIRSARVLVIGAGGLASPVLQYLVGAGVNYIRLVDPDIVDETNLHRQTLFREDDIGVPKAEAAALHMDRLNHECHIEQWIARFEPSNAWKFCAGVDLVIDCADSFAATYIASDHCLGASIPLISASVVGSEGYCGGFCGAAPSVRAVFPDLPERLGSCDADGVLGPSVGVIGSLQAQMALAVITDASPSPLGQLVTYDALAMRFGGFRFDKAREPRLQHRFISDQSIRDEDFVVDLRAANEPGAKVAHTMRAEVGDFGTKNDLVPQGTQRAVLVCRSGLRSWQAADRLSKHWNGEIALIAMGDG